MGLEVVRRGWAEASGWAILMGFGGVMVSGAFGERTRSCFGRLDAGRMCVAIGLWGEAAGLLEAARAMDGG